MLLTQDQEMIRDAVRDFAQTELWPHAARWDKEHHFPKEAHQGLAALGAYGICVPEELGGAHLDYVTLALVLEEIAAGDGGTSTAISGWPGPGWLANTRAGVPSAATCQWLTRSSGNCADWCAPAIRLATPNRSVRPCTAASCAP